jgi:hypothetical protein
MAELHEAINNLNFAVSILCVVVAIKCAVMIWDFVFELKRIKVTKWRW